MNIDKIKNIMDKCINSREEVGASFVLMKNGVQVMNYSCGSADLANNIPMNDKTICRAFSCSKIATSVCAMILMERGLLDISWELERIIPEFANPAYIRDGKEIRSESIRIRDLLNMTSGIPYPWSALEGENKTNELWMELHNSIVEEKSMTTIEFAKRAAECHIMYNAGDEWMYGASADILGAVVEIVSGQRLSEFMHENIFAPLGMNDTAFYVPEEKLGRLAVLYENAGENPKAFEGVNLCIFDMKTRPDFESGGAGLFSTAHDYAKLGAMLSNGGIYEGKRILSRKTIEFMSSSGLKNSQRHTLNWESTKGYNYANLVRIVENQNEAGTFASKGSFGWDGWTGTYLLCDPTEKIAVTLFIQRCGAGTTQLSRNLVNVVYSMI